MGVWPSARSSLPSTQFPRRRHIHIHLLWPKDKKKQHPRCSSNQSGHTLMLFLATSSLYRFVSIHALFLPPSLPPVPSISIPPKCKTQWTPAFLLLVCIDPTRPVPDQKERATMVIMSTTMSMQNEKEEKRQTPASIPPLLASDSQPSSLSQQAPMPAGGWCLSVRLSHKKRPKQQKKKDRRDTDPRL